MHEWRFLEDDADLLADLLLFHPATVPLSGPPTPPPPPPGRAGCNIMASSPAALTALQPFAQECTVLPSSDVFVLSAQGRLPNFPVVTVGSALLFSMLCLATFFVCRHHKRKMDSFLAYKPAPHLNHVVLGSAHGQTSSQIPSSLLSPDQNDCGLPDMYGGYGATLASSKVLALTPSLVILDRNRSASTSSKEHLNPIYEELDQRNEYESVAELPSGFAHRAKKLQFVAMRGGSENIYASIEDQRYC